MYNDALKICILLGDPELNLALDKEYTVLEAYEIWNWSKKNRSHLLFKEYMNNVHKIKIAVWM